jgi:hypothetical protein
MKRRQHMEGQETSHQVVKQLGEVPFQNFGDRKVERIQSSSFGISNSWYAK